ncbi:hypothetical protein PybrP1_011773 [[Pythium] brassicae (nom. inval.)]|nr:hypothetical protein PybrP1_011773 [[Pythium] brassicae (nom. inval.)]
MVRYLTSFEGGTRAHITDVDTLPGKLRAADYSLIPTNQSNQDTRLPEIAPLSEEQRKLRDAEKARQAQERARARLARTYQHDQFVVERESEARRQQVLRQERECAERERLAEQSRLRAEDRVRMKHRLFSATQLTAGTESKTSELCPERPVTNPAQLERFRRKTLARLQALSLSSKNSSVVEMQHANERRSTEPALERDDEEESVMRATREKKLRQETAQRIRRQRAAEEELRRNDRELLEQGLSQYKTRQKELERVAKGLAPLPPRPALSVTKRANEVPSEPQDHDGTDSDDVGDCEPSTRVVLLSEGREGIDALCAASAARSGQRKLPPWKRPPVPVLPVEFYACKAVLPVSRASGELSGLTLSSSSYTEKFRSRIPGAATTAIASLKPKQPS